MTSSRFDGEHITQEKSSNHSHHSVYSLESYKGLPFVTGSYSPGHKKTEIFDIYLNEWFATIDYPFSPGNQ